MNDPTDFNAAFYECQQAAIESGALRPQGISESLAANWMSCQGQRWEDCPRARQRLQEWTLDCLRNKGINV